MKLDFNKNHRLLFGMAGGGFIILSIMVAVAPAAWVQENTEPLPDSEPLDSLERAGLAVYVAEGCAYCHTQQVRPLEQDRDFGRPSHPGDYARLQRLDFWRQTPGLLGTERTGPDLSDIGSRQPSATWHHIHLYQPRAVVQGSVMPAFPWLYRVEGRPDSAAVTVGVPDPHGPPEGTVVAGRDARALVAYMMALRQAPLPGGRAGGGPAPGGESGETGSGEVSGARVFQNNCATCHQTDGQGVPGSFPPLAGDPVVTADDPTRHVEIVLNGLQGKTIEGTTYQAAMPAWGDRLSDAEIAAVVNHERTSWGNDAPTVTAEEVAGIREGQS